VTTTARRDLRTYSYALLQAFMAADTGRVAEVFKSRPPHFNRPMPVAWVDILSEAATHAGSLRTRTLSPSFVFVGDPDLGVDEFDALVDTFADFLTAHPQIVPNTVWEDWTITDESEEIQSEQGIRTFPVVRFAVSDFTVQEGRT
jgi:hypothetical protein